MAKPAFNPKLPFEVLDKKPPFDPSKPFEVLDQPQAAEPTGLEQFETAGRSALEGMSLGASEPVISGINAVVGNLIDAGFDAESIGEFAKKAVSGEAIKQQYERDIARRKGLEAALPGTAMTAEIAGGLLSPANKAIGALGGMAGKLAAPLKALPMGGAAAATLGEAALKGATLAAIPQAVKEAVQIPTGVMSEQEALPLSDAAETGAKIGAGLAAIPMVGKGLAQAFPKALSAVGGVRSDVISKYLERKEPVEKLPFEELKAKTDEAIRKVQDTLGEQKVQVTDDLITAVKSLKDKVDQGSKDSYKILEQTVKKPVTKSNLMKNFKLNINDDELLLKGKGVSLSAREVHDVNYYLETTKKLPFENVIALEDVTVDPNLQGRGLGTKAVQAFEQKAKELGYDGIVLNASPTSTHEKKEKLNDLIKFYKNLGFKAFGPKQVENQLMVKALKQEPSQNNFYINAKDILSEVEKQIADQSSGKGKVFLNPVREAAAQKLEDLKTRFQALAEEGNGKFDLPTAKELLQSLDETTQFAKNEGTYTGRLDRSFQKIRRAIDEPLKALSPEYKAKMAEVADDTRLLTEASKAFGEPTAALRNVQTLVVGKNIPVNSVASKLEEKTGVQISKGIQGLQKAQPVAALKPETSESFLKSVLGDRSIQNKKTLGLLSELSDTDLNSMADRAALTQEFSKLTQNGARDVLFGTLAGGAAFGIPGVPMGAAVGYLVKTFGAPATKTILDGLIQVKGYPTVQKIKNALGNVDPQIRAQLLQTVVRSEIVRDEADPERMIQVDAQTAENLKNELRTSQMSSLKKMKALRDLNEKQAVNAQTLRDYTLGRQKPKPMMMPLPKSDLKIDKPDVLKSLQRMQETR